MRSIKSVLSALLFAFSVSLTQPATAVDIERWIYDLGTIAAPDQRDFGDTLHATGGKTFLDHFVFTLTPDAWVNSVSVTMRSWSGTFNIVPGSFDSRLWALDGTPHEVAMALNYPNPLGSTSVIDYTPLNAGHYDLRIAGTISTGASGGSFGGTIAAVPVPEPGTFAMIAAGLGLMGYIVRRRKR